MKKLKKVAIVGHFAFGKNLLNGQTVKTKIITGEIEKVVGKSKVLTIDTHGGKKIFVKIVKNIIKALKNCEIVVIIPASTAARILVPILVFFNRFYKRQLVYVEIGAWMQSRLSEHRRLIKKMQAFDRIYAETTTSFKVLQKLNFQNMEIMPNCKSLQALEIHEMKYPSGEPYKLCTFSRVMKEKGVEDAINAVIAINEELGRIAYTLDIYGQIDRNQIEWFDNLQKEFPTYIHYGGIVPFDESVEVLKNYFALLFPSRYYCEGIPGTIIDAYSAGIPVISVKWENFGDIIEDGVTGIGYDFEDENGLRNCLLEVLLMPQKMIELKQNCLEKSKVFYPEEALKPLLRFIS